MRAACHSKLKKKTKRKREGQLHNTHRIFEEGGENKASGDAMSVEISGFALDEDPEDCPFR